MLSLQSHHGSYYGGDPDSSKVAVLRAPQMLSRPVKPPARPSAYPARATRYVAEIAAPLALVPAGYSQEIRWEGPERSPASQVLRQAPFAQALEAQVPEQHLAEPSLAGQPPVPPVAIPSLAGPLVGQPPVRRLAEPLPGVLPPAR